MVDTDLSPQAQQQQDYYVDGEDLDDEGDAYDDCGEFGGEQPRPISDVAYHQEETYMQP